MAENAFIDIKPTIKIDGEDNDDLRQALSALVINVPLSGMAHGELTLSNWIQSGDEGQLGFGFQEIGFGKTIDILMGQEQEISIFSGEITAVEERYGNSAPELILLVQDKLHILSRQRENRVFEDESINAVVEFIANELGMSAEVNISTAVETYHQMNESNLAFLTRLLNQYGIALRIEGGNIRAKPEETDNDPIELSPSDSALKIRLIADLNHQANKIIVQGFNITVDEPISEESENLDNPGDGITAKSMLEELSWPGENIVPQPFARNQTEAEALAKAHFARNAKRFISGDISCIGEPTLKSGKEIELIGVSPRMQGKYQIVHCTHCYDSSNGFETHLKVNRAVGHA